MNSINIRESLRSRGAVISSALVIGMGAAACGEKTHSSTDAPPQEELIQEPTADVTSPEETNNSTQGDFVDATGPGQEEAVTANENILPSFFIQNNSDVIDVIDKHRNSGELINGFRGVLIYYLNIKNDSDTTEKYRLEIHDPLIVEHQEALYAYARTEEGEDLSFPVGVRGGGTDDYTLLFSGTLNVDLEGYGSFHELIGDEESGQLIGVRVLEDGSFEDSYATALGRTTTTTHEARAYIDIKNVLEEGDILFPQEDSDRLKQDQRLLEDRA